MIVLYACVVVVAAVPTVTVGLILFEFIRPLFVEWANWIRWYRHDHQHRL